MNKSLEAKNRWWPQAQLMVILGLAAFGLSYFTTRIRRDTGNASPAASVPQETTKVVAPVAQPKSGEAKEAKSAPEGMVWVPGGEFWMGTDSKDAWPDEQPAHKVRVDGFFIDVT